MRFIEVGLAWLVAQEERMFVGLRREKSRVLPTYSKLNARVRRSRAWYDSGVV
jgi:hypothetical protein